MFDELKIRLDTLNDLHTQGYINNEEYNSAKENLLLDAGFDIVPRAPGERALVVMQAPRKNKGCGCFMIFILLFFAAIGVIMALPQEMIQDVPVLKLFFTEDGRETTRQWLLRFIDDLRGNPVQSPDPTLQTHSPTTPHSSAPAHTPVTHEPAPDLPRSSVPISHTPVTHESTPDLPRSSHTPVTHEPDPDLPRSPSESEQTQLELAQPEPVDLVVSVTPLPQEPEHDLLVASPNTSSPPAPVPDSDFHPGSRFKQDDVKDDTQQELEPEPEPSGSTTRGWWFQ